MKTCFYFSAQIRFVKWFQVALDYNNGKLLVGKREGGPQRPEPYSRGGKSLFMNIRLCFVTVYQWSPPVLET